jgi:hypothetical protein
VRHLHRLGWISASAGSNTPPRSGSCLRVLPAASRSCGGRLPRRRPCLHRTGAGHALRALGHEPLLDLRLRLGEKTGAALAIPVAQAAARVLSDVALLTDLGWPGSRRIRPAARAVRWRTASSIAPPARICGMRLVCARDRTSSGSSARATPVSTSLQFHTGRASVSSLISEVAASRPVVCWQGRPSARSWVGPGS